MPKYRVIGTVHASKYLGEFEAETADGAIERALNSKNNYVCFCPSCWETCGETLEPNDSSCREAVAELIDEEGKRNER